jgi:hypothetical protein
VGEAEKVAVPPSAAASWSGAVVLEEDEPMKPRRRLRAGRVALAALAVAILSTGAGNGAAALRQGASRPAPVVAPHPAPLAIDPVPPPASRADAPPAEAATPAPKKKSSHRRIARRRH